MKKVSKEPGRARLRRRFVAFFAATSFLAIGLTHTSMIRRNPCSE